MKSRTNISAVLLCLLYLFDTTATGVGQDYTSNPTIQAFKTATSVKWGKDNVDLPSACTWVEYEPDLGERFVVCFKSGIARVQILLRESDNAESEIIMSHAREGIRTLVLASGNDTYKKFHNEYNITFNKELPSTYTVKKGDNLWVLSKKLRIRHGEIEALNQLDHDAVLKIGQVLNLPSKAPHFIEKNTTISDGKTPVLIGQLKLKNGTVVTKDNIDQFTKEMVAGNNHKVRRITGSDGIVRKELTIEFKLVDDHLQRRAQLYRPAVHQYATKFNLNEAMLLALIHTESHFNPRARSSAPAYGLMQVVPKTGGRDATKFLFGKEKQLSSSYLYNPNNNIQIGSAYMHMLATRYWGDVKDPVSRQYCIIAAYNGGSGNVARVFAGTKSRRNAIKKINTMSADQVYKKLRGNHHLKETRTYLKRVTERAPLYAGK